MKKLTQICSVLCLVFAFSIIPANAQTTKTIKADIPFDFYRGGNLYRAGNYKLNITDSRPGVFVSITDNENNILDNFLVTVAGEAPSGDAQLVFNNYGGQRFLSRITTREGIYNIIRTSTERQIASRRKRSDKRPEIVAIAIGYEKGRQRENLSGAGTFSRPDFLFKERPFEIEPVQRGPVKKQRFYLVVIRH